MTKQYMCTSLKKSGGYLTSSHSILAIVRLIAIQAYLSCASLIALQHFNHPHSDARVYY